MTILDDTINDLDILFDDMGIAAKIDNQDITLVQEDVHRSTPIGNETVYMRGLQRMARTADIEALATQPIVGSLVSEGSSNYRISHPLMPDGSGLTLIVLKKDV